jgi:hypothetical protein
MSGRLRLTPLLAAVLVGVVSTPALAQAAGSQSSAIGVSVTVVRPCTVASPSASAAPSAPSAHLSISCGRGSSRTSLLTGGAVPVPGITTAPAVTTSKGQHGLVVSVDF